MGIKALLMAECHECWRKPMSYRDATKMEKENENSCLSENSKEAVTT